VVTPLRLLDVFCGGGGASMGYARAGFVVTGVDIEPIRNYPFRFIRADALDILNGDCSDYDVIHASPPCERYSAMTTCRPGLRETYPDLIGPVRDALRRQRKPYIIENVPQAPLRNPVVLCGRSFGLALYRHRLFESNVTLTAPPHYRHDIPTSDAGHWKPGTIMSVSGHVAPIAHAKRVMGIDWMRREELVEAIPPAYTHHLGLQLRSYLEARAA
jgi:DNA (cytosine-5)-methyltransferase 1